MTADADGGDLAGIAGAPRHVLDPDGLDLLELELAIAGTSGPADGAPVDGAPVDGGLAGPVVVLTDAENSPLAEARTTRDGALAIRALRPFARGSGPQWDRAVRRPAAEVAAEISEALEAGRGSRVVGIVVDDVPAIGDIEALVARALESDVAALVVAVPVARMPRAAGEVGWAGLVRAAWGAADTLAASGPRGPVIRLVIPWPAAWPAAEAGAAAVLASRAPDLGAAMAAFGVTETVRVSVGRSGRDRERVAALAGVLERAVRAVYPPASAREVLRARATGHRRGAVVFFTGLSGSGKSTIARALVDDLADRVAGQVTLLDGDEVRQHLSSELGFDARSRDLNIERIAWVAALVADHGGIAVAAPIAPFAATRRRAREMVRAPAVFLLVHVDAPLAVCEARDRKGLYARARAGEIAEFTGISSPYERPDDADVTVDTTTVDVPEAVARIREALEARLRD